MGLHVMDLDQIRDAMGEHARLARARPSEDQQRPLEVRDGRALRLVEAGEQWMVRLRRTARLAGPLAAHPPTPPPRSRLTTRAMTPANVRRNPESHRRSRDTAPRNMPRKNSSTKATRIAR